MKKTLLFTALFLSGYSFSQTFTQANEPQIGSSATMFLCDSNVTNYASVVGNNVTWDYSQIAKVDGEVRTITVADPAGSPFASDFPGANKAIAIQGFTTNFWETSATERRSLGFIFEEPTFGTVKAIYDTDDALVLNYPFNLNGTVRDPFAGTLSFNLSGQAMNPAATGFKDTKYDGTGILKLNSTTTLSNVARIHTIDTLRATVDIIISTMDVMLVIDQYEYYDLDNGDMPVFTHTHGLILQDNATEPMMEFTVVLNSVEPDQILSASKIDDLKFNVYPNPVTDEIKLAGNFENASVEVISQTGQVVKTVDNVLSGVQISMNDINPGIYFLKVKSANGQSVQKIVKK